ncbi:MAG: hypothetical protein H6765_05455 [Candidatus Peribacteria bacterium]|nr:MAG: hypothetical protein H6765_05455 [Candidatus Peribacteria bacterium]
MEETYLLQMVSSTIFLALGFGLLSALYILHEKEPLYLVLLMSFFVLFTFWLLVFTLNGMSIMLEDTIILVLLGMHLAVLWELSLQCFGAVRGGGNYRKQKKDKKK